MNTELLTELLKGIAMTSPIGLITWFFTKRHFQKVELKKATSEAEGSQADVMVKHISIYQDMLDDICARKDAEISGLEERLMKLELRIEECEKEIP